MAIDWWTLAIQTVNFLIVVWLLSRLLYRPVRRRIEAREQADRAAAEAAGKKAEEAEALRMDYEQKLASLDEQARRREADLHEAMRRETEQSLSEARKEAEDLRAGARADAEAAKTSAIALLHEDIAALAHDLARAALAGAGADPVACLKARLTEQAEADIARMRRDLSSGGTLTLVTAATLGDEMRARLRETLAETFGSGADIAFEVDPEVLGGMRLQLPHGVLDASVAGRLDTAARAMAGDEDAA